VETEGDTSIVLGMENVARNDLEESVIGMLDYDLLNVHGEVDLYEVEVEEAEEAEDE
jgi:hypothetical protein